MFASSSDPSETARISLIPLVGRRPLIRLPRPPTTFVAREREIASLVDLLRGQDVRLVTLTGPGGVGKTRLAIQVAAEIAAKSGRDVAFVPLAPVGDPRLVPSAIAQVLELRDGGNSTMAEALASFLRDREMLLVLDNFEHLLDTALFVADLLMAVPALSILVTSRARLDLRAEHEFPVKPLSVPEDGAMAEPGSLDRYSSVRLFVARAQALRPDFALTTDNAAAIAAICSRLEGLPLAIELAAARIAHLPPPALLSRLDRSLPLLTGGPRDQPDRLRTMQDAIAWSYDLLSPSDQALLRSLAVCAGGFTLDAAAAVSGAEPDSGQALLDGVASLVRQSLIQQVGELGDEPRYAMLETIREFARDRLETSGEAEEARRRHADFFLAFAEAQATRLGGADMGESLAQLSADLPNLRAAFAWALASRQHEDILRVAAGLYPFWNFRGHLREGRRWLEEAIKEVPAETLTSIDGLLAIAGLAALQGDNRVAQALAEDASRRSRACRYAFGEARALFLLGIAAEWRGDVDLAASFYRASLQRRDDFVAPHWIARSLASLADVVYLQGDIDEAETLANEGLAQAGEAGHAWTEALALGVLARIAIDRADYAEAIQRCRETLRVSDALGDLRGVAGVIAALAGLLFASGSPRRALRLLAAARALGQSIGAAHVAHYLYYERILAAVRGCLDQETFAATWAEGFALSSEAAIAEAFVEAERVAQHAERAIRNALDLTPREEDVLRLLTAGYTDREIGDALFISHRTVNAHVAHIFGKLGVRSRAQASVEAVRRGYVAAGTGETAK